MSIMSFFVHGYEFNKREVAKEKSGEAERERKIREPYEEYRALLEQILASAELCEMVAGNIRYLVPKRYRRGDPAAEILSEPTFAKDYDNKKLKYEGLKIRVNNQYYQDIILSFVNKYNNLFPQEKAEMIKL